MKIRRRINTKPNQNMVSGLVAVVLGILVLRESVQMFSYRYDILMGDHIMPGFVGVMMILLGIWLAFFAEPSKVKAEFPTGPMRLRVLGVFGILFLYAALIQTLGYTVGSLISGYLLFRIFGKFGRLGALIASVLLCLGLYLVFVLWLGVPLPRGPFRLFGLLF